MKRNIFLIVAFLFIQIIEAQPDSLFLKLEPVKYDGPQWNYKNNASLYLSEVAFVNWSSGGVNSISGLLGFQSSANYSDKYFSWKNDALLRLGINRQEGKDLQKSDDVLELNSNLGYKPDVSSNWFYSAKFNYKTQLFNGYKYPDVSEPISRFMPEAAKCWFRRVDC